MAGRAAALGEARGAEVGWAQLQALPQAELAGDQPYWTLAAQLLRRMGRMEEAEDAYARAIGLCEDRAMRALLVEQARRSR